MAGKKRKSTGVNYYKPKTLGQRVKQLVRKIKPKRATRRTKKTLN